MKKLVLTFGLISGAVLSLMMILTLPFMDRIGFDRAEILGYTTMVLSFLMVYVGIRSYRENIGGGAITFGRALWVGLLITLVSCVCYVVTWEILYYSVASVHDFMNKYASYMAEQAKTAGATPGQIEVQVQQVERMRELYKNPFFNVAMTFIEPFPIGLLITLISAAILRKKKPDLVTAAQSVT
jgi:uncharacterized protein DUF4199